MERPIKERIQQIVLTGYFNPQIFQPAWLGAKGLLRPAEAEKAKVKIINSALADFSIDWATFQITSSMFAITSTNDSSSEPLKDIVIGIFKLLEETPIMALGINNGVHFQVEDAVTWNKIGHKLIPKEPLWNQILTEPRTRGLTVEGQHLDKAKGRVLVQIEPSNPYPMSVYVLVNHHFDIAESQSGMGSGLDAHALIQKKWEYAATDAKQIINKLVSEL